MSWVEAADWHAAEPDPLAASAAGNIANKKTNHTNGLCHDAQGRLYGCCSGGRSIVRFEPDGTTPSIADPEDGQGYK